MKNIPWSADKKKAYDNYLKAHGFTPEEGWDDDYYCVDFEENWQDYIEVA